MNKLKIEEEIYRLIPTLEKLQYRLAMDLERGQFRRGRDIDSIKRRMRDLYEEYKSS